MDSMGYGHEAYETEAHEPTRTHIHTYTRGQDPSETHQPNRGVKQAT